SMRVNLGIDLLSPGAGLKLSAMLSARASLSAAMSAALGAGVMANLSAYARAAAALSAMGITSFGGLKAALSLALSLKLPTINIPFPSLGLAASMLNSVALAMPVLGL